MSSKEQGVCFTTSYSSCLILEDLTILSDQGIGIIDIPCGPSRVFEQWKVLGLGLNIRYSCEKHNQMKRETSILDVI